MKTVTVESADILDEDMQLEIHYAFGMEHYTDYVFTPRGDMNYSATIVFENSQKVIDRVVKRSVDFPENEFIVEELDMESGVLTMYLIQNGSFSKLSNP